MLGQPETHLEFKTDDCVVTLDFVPFTSRERRREFPWVLILWGVTNGIYVRRYVSMSNATDDYNTLMVAMLDDNNPLTADQAVKLMGSSYAA